jgi:hypothetical protein
LAIAPGFADAMARRADPANADLADTEYPADSLVSLLAEKLRIVQAASWHMDLLRVRLENLLEKLQCQEDLQGPTVDPSSSITGQA